MAGITTGVKTQVFVGPATHVVGSSNNNLALADYTSETWTAVGNIKEVGEFGDAAEVISYATITDGRKQKLRGISSAGKLTLTCANNSTDAGQTLLKAASALPLMCAFKVILNDPLTPSTGVGSTYYFRALVMSGRTKVGGGSDVVEISFDAEINTAVLFVPAT